MIATTTENNNSRLLAICIYQVINIIYIEEIIIIIIIITTKALPSLYIPSLYHLSFPNSHIFKHSFFCLFSDTLNFSFTLSLFHLQTLNLVTESWLPWETMLSCPTWNLRGCSAWKEAKEKPAMPTIPKHRYHVKAHPQIS